MNMLLNMALFANNGQDGDAVGGGEIDFFQDQKEIKKVELS